MSGLFDDRWGSLIKERSQTFSDRIRVRPEFMACIVRVVNGRVDWSSRRYELSSFPTLASFHLFADNPSGTRFELWVTIPSIDGFTAHIEKFKLLVSVVRLGISKPFKLDLSKSFIQLDDRKLKLLELNRKMPRQTWHFVRQRSLKGRWASDRFFVKPKRRRGEMNGTPNSRSSVFQTNFVREQNNVTVIDSIGSITVPELTTSVSRVNTPNFFSLKKRDRPINPYSMTQVTKSTRMGYQKVSSTDQPTVTELNWAGPTEYFYSEAAPDLTYDPVARDKAFKSLIKSIDIDTHRESSNLAESTVQLKQVVRMIGNTATKLLTSYRALKRGDLRRATRALFGSRPPRFRRNGYLSASKSVAENWLELQYGWKPLLSDIAVSIDSLAREFHPLPRIARGVGNTSSTTEVDILGPFNVSLASVNAFPAGKRVRVKQTRVEIGMRYTVSDSDRAVLAQTGFLSPVSLAWELIPFSFVVDWFYPIGPYLESLTTFDGMSFVDGYESRFVRETSGVLVRTSGIHGVFPQRVLIDARFGSQRQAVKFDRIKLFSFPDRPRVRLKNPISVVHAANAVALLVANFGK